MAGLIETLLSFPVVMFSVPLALSLVYWLFVIVGAVDVDLFGVDGAAEGLAEGAAEGVAEGLAEGAAEGLAEGAAEGWAEGAAEGLAEGAAEGGAEGLAHLLGGLVAALKLRSAPITVVASMFFFWGWLISLLATRFLSPIFGSAPHWLVGSGIFAGTFVLATLATSGSVRPLAPIFEVPRHRGGKTLVGQTVKVKTTIVDERLGQAIHDDGAAGILLEIRSRGEGLKRGDEALIIDYDDARGVYWVEPMRALLAEHAEDAPTPVAASAPETSTAETPPSETGAIPEKELA